MTTTQTIDFPTFPPSIARRHTSPEVVFETTDGTTVRSAFQNTERRLFGTGHIVSVVTEKSMGTVTMWQVVMFPTNRPVVDTSCTECGTHHRTTCPR